MNWNHLHVYAQSDEGQDAWIVGDRDALAALRDALTGLLEGGPAHVGVDVMAGDGEGYKLIVVREDRDEEWETLATEYIGPLPAPVGSTVPYQLIGKDAYRAMFPRAAR